MAFNNFSLEQLSNLGKNTLTEHFEIEITEASEEQLCAKMPVTNKTVQPMRLLHGGASVALAESLGSIAGIMHVPDPNKQAVVGVEINANHVRSAREGDWIYAICKPLHIGRTTMVFEIKINNEAGKLICISRLTVAVVNL